MTTVDTTCMSKMDNFTGQAYQPQEEVYVSLARAQLAGAPNLIKD